MQDYHSLIISNIIWHNRVRDYDPTPKAVLVVQCTHRKIYGGSQGLYCYNTSSNSRGFRSFVDRRVRVHC